MNTTTAPCGCRFEGRFAYTWDCTAIDRNAATGYAITAHTTRARRAAK